VVDSESRIVSKTVGLNLLVIRLARTIRYFLSVSKETILTNWYEVAFSNFCEFHLQEILILIVFYV